MNELPLQRESLYAPVLAVGYVHNAVVRYPDGVDDAELIGTRPVGDAIQTRRRALVLIHRLIAERTPHALESSGVRIHDDDAMIAIAVSDKHLVGLRINHRVGWLMEVFGIRIAFALRATADLLDE